jgi:regulation of enolase protein 1 (concanavalin A-like superfamily)
MLQSSHTTAWLRIAGAAKRISASSLLAASLVWSLTANGATFTDDFSVTHDYLANGISGGIWDGFIYNVNGGNCTVFSADANISNPGQLTFSSVNGQWGGGGSYGNDSGILLYKNVTGDFDAQIQVISANSLEWNDLGLMARQGGVAPANENWVGVRYFAALGFNSTRSVVNGSESDMDQTGLQPWLRLTRVGNVFTTYRSTNGVNWSQMSAVTRNDVDGVPLEVGIWQATFSGNTGTAVFGNFWLWQPTPTTTLLTTMQSTNWYGSNVTFTATVQTNGTTATQATGTVAFLDGLSLLSTVTATNGVASFSISTLLPGSHTIWAVYSGDANYQTSSTSVSQQVNTTLLLTTTIVASSPNPSALGDNVTFTATILTNGVTATAAGGSVLFEDGDTPLDTNNVSGGVAAYTNNTLALGAHYLTALYSGDANYSPSLSGTVTQMVQLVTNPAYSLENAFIRADLDARGLIAVYDKSSGKTVQLGQDEFYVSVGNDTVASSSLTPFIEQQTSTNRAYRLDYGQWTLRASYELRPGWRFVSKQISIVTAATNDFTVNRVDPIRGALSTAITAQQSVNSGLLLHFNDGGGTPVSHGLFVNLQTAPQYASVSVSGQQLTVSYSPGLVWNMSYGTYLADRVLLGPYTLSGVTYPATQIGEWQYIPDGTPVGGATIDRAELDALVDCVRAFLLWKPTNSTRVHVGWCENDYQIDVGTAAGQTEYKRILDQAAAVGCSNVLYAPANSLLSSISANSDAWGWENLLWLALGQQIRTNAWFPGSNAVPASVQTMLNYAHSDNLKLLAYAYPSLPFNQNPQWTAGTGFADTGQRSFQDWWLQLLVDFQNATGLGGYSFDYWHLGVNGAPSTPYAQWFGCRRVLEEMRRRVPSVVVDGRQQYQGYGAWTWLGGTYPHPLTGDEQPVSFQACPDLHWSRVSADRQRHAAWWYRMQNFCPLEILPGYMTHQTPRQNASGGMPRTAFRTRDWDYLGWRYSVISSIGTAPFNHVVNFLPARDTNEFNAFGDTDKQWLRGWLDWTDQNMDLLRNLHPIINQPQLGRVDGTAAFTNGYGVVFLFNPNYRALTANLSLDQTIGLTNGGPFILRQLYPDAERGKLLPPSGKTFWDLGDVVSLPMPGADALVLEVTNAPPITQPLLLGAQGSAAFNAGQLALTNVVGQVGGRADLQILMPAGQTVASVTVNGLPAGFEQSSNTVSMSVNFAGTPFQRLQQIGSYDPNFTGGVYTAQIPIPTTVFQQLAARQSAWPIPYTPDDLLATWLGSYRLLLFVNVASPSPSMVVSLQVDGQSVTLTPAYMTIYNIGANGSFVGWYADLSSLTPDVPHQFQLTLPTLAAGQFQGLFLDNVEAQFTNAVQEAGTAADNFNTPHDYLAEGLAGTIWEGIYTKAGDIPNTGLGSDGPGSTLVADASMTSNGVLTVQSTRTDWDGTNDDGFFLFKNVSGNFQAQVHVTRLDQANYNFGGLMARLASLSNGENYVIWGNFNQLGYGNYVRSVAGGVSANLPIGGGATTSTFIMLERTDNTFKCYQRGNSIAPWLLVTNYSRPDLRNLPLQVGIMQACFSTNSPVAQFGGFSLQTFGSLADSTPVPASGLEVSSGANDTATIAWSPGAGSTGSLVVMRANGPITAQPALGASYNASPTFGGGTDLGGGNYVVYSGNGNTVTVTGLSAGTVYSVAVYAFGSASGTFTYALNGAAAGSFSKQVLQSIALNLDSAIATGGARQARVQAIYSGNVTQDVTTAASFQSSAPGIVAVNTNGIVTALSPGMAAITASFGGAASVMNVVVQPFVLEHRYAFTNDASDSIGGASGILMGDAVISGGQLVLDGTGGTFVDLPIGLFMSFNSITIEIWVTDKGSGAWARIYDFGNSVNGEGQQGGSTQDMFLSLPSGFGNLRGSYTLTGGGSGEQVLEWPNGGRPPVGQKSHIVWATDGGAQTGWLYINGVLVGQNNAMTLTPASFGPTLNDWIGKSQFTADAYFNGAIDEFRIYEGALTAQQVQNNYLAGPDLPPVQAPWLLLAASNTNLIVSWPVSAPGFALQSSLTLGIGSSWTNVNASITTTNGLYQVTLLPSPGAATFYRLKE